MDLISRVSHDSMGLYPLWTHVPIRSTTSAADQWNARETNYFEDMLIPSVQNFWILFLLTGAAWALAASIENCL